MPNEAEARFQGGKSHRAFLPRAVRPPSGGGCMSTMRERTKAGWTVDWTLAPRCDDGDNQNQKICLKQKALR
jgi:hypothetical protein